MREDDARKVHPSNVLVVTFRTPELQFMQVLRQHTAMLARWRRVRAKMVRWYSPGGSISGAQILAEIRRHITRARRFGLPLERILFDGAEVAESFLPALKREPLFWPTVFEMINTEAISSIFVIGDPRDPAPLVSVLHAEVDYSFRLSRLGDGGAGAEAEGAAGQIPAEVSAVAGGERRGRIAPMPVQRGYIELLRVPHLAPLKLGVQVPFTVDQHTRLLL